MPEYQRIGRVEDFAAGRMQPIRLGTRDIAILNTGDRFYAFDDFCSHEAVSFTSGYGVFARDRIVCMLHSSAFDIDTGEVLAGPAPDPLTFYDVRREGDDVFLSI